MMTTPCQAKNKSRGLLLTNCLKNVMSVLFISIAFLQFNGLWQCLAPPAAVGTFSVNISHKLNSTTMLRYGDQSSVCNGWDEKDNGGGGDDGMAETPGEQKQKTMLEDHAQRDGQCQAVVEAPLLEVSFGGEEHVQMIAHDDGLTDNSGINNNSRHSTAFAEVSGGEENVQINDDGLTDDYGINNNSRHSTAFAEDVLSVMISPGAISRFLGLTMFAEALRFGDRRFYAANVFWLSLSLGAAASPSKQLDSRIVPATTMAPESRATDGGTWWIWAAAVILLLLLLLGGGGLAFVVWKRRQSAPTVPAITVEVPADEDEIEMTEMAAAPTRRWEAYPGAWNTATGSFKGGQALF